MGGNLTSSPGALEQKGMLYIASDPTAYKNVSLLMYAASSWNGIDLYSADGLFCNAMYLSVNGVIPGFG